MNFKGLRLAAGAFALVAAGIVSAAPALPTAGILEDDNKEYVLDANGNLKTSGSLAVGDTLHAVVNFTKILNLDNSTFLNLGTPPNTIYGISVLEVGAIVGNQIIFKANAGFEATYGAGALAALFTGGSLDIGCTTRANCETQATSGSEWLTVGFGDADDYWIAEGTLGFPITTNLATIAGTNGATKVALANYALSVLENNTGYTFAEQACPICAALNPADDNMTDIIGSGDVLGGAGLGDGFIARSDFDFSFARVPEPGTLALLGLGVLGIGMSRRRQAK